MKHAWFCVTFKFNWHRTAGNVQRFHNNYLSNGTSNTLFNIWKNQDFETSVDFWHKIWQPLHQSSFSLPFSHQGTFWTWKMAAETLNAFKVFSRTSWQPKSCVIRSNLPELFHIIWLLAFFTILWKIRWVYPKRFRKIFQRNLGLSGT